MCIFFHSNDKGTNVPCLFWHFKAESLKFLFQCMHIFIWFVFQICSVFSWKGRIHFSCNIVKYLLSRNSEKGLICCETIFKWKHTSHNSFKLGFKKLITCFVLKVKNLSKYFFIGFAIFCYTGKWKKQNLEKMY